MEAIKRIDFMFRNNNFAARWISPPINCKLKCTHRWTRTSARAPEEKVSGVSVEQAAELIIKSKTRIKLWKNMQWKAFLVNQDAFSIGRGVAHANSSAPRYRMSVLLKMSFSTAEPHKYAFRGKHRGDVQHVSAAHSAGAHQLQRCIGENFRVFGSLDGWGCDGDGGGRHQCARIRSYMAYGFTTIYQLTACYRPFRT